MKSCLSILGALLFAAVVTTGCSSRGNASPDTEPRGTLVVFAAASLTDVFTVIAADFEAAYPDIEVKLNFAGSQSLRTQINNGAQPQVFASANAEHMDALRDSGLVDEPVVFAHNEMVIAVPVANPAGIESGADLANARRLVLAGENVPAGAYAAAVIDKASSSYGADFAERVNRRVVSREMDVRHTLQKLLLGEADACMVYATDAAAAGDGIRSIAIEAEHNVVASYPIAALSRSPRAHLGRLFVEFVGSQAGIDALEQHGFRPARVQPRANEPR